MATVWSGALLVMVKFGYVPLVDIPVLAVKATVWSGALLVMVSVPLVVIGLPLTVIPVPAVAATLVTVPVPAAVDAIVTPLLLLVTVTLDPARMFIWVSSIILFKRIAVASLVSQLALSSDQVYPVCRSDITV